jgi:hypothetical protein
LLHILVEPAHNADSNTGVAHTTAAGHDQSTIELSPQTSR